ncbi:MAG: lysylphosphatidylglycerol synthase transmembrane domain-containing protein [Candidatus Hydrothermia bacterium]|nr:lysylphosphatidylglycerol synthase transmembrane domain-containing protein [Candidatus Hydrothermia bacterium]
MRKVIFELVKILISVILIYIIFKNMDIRAFLNHLKSINLLLYLIAIVFGFIGYFFSAVRWFIFIKAYKLNVSFFEANKYVFVGLFLGLILPSGAGVDLVRFFYAQRNNLDRRAEVLSSIFVDRFVGVIALVCLALLGVYFGVEKIREVAKELIWIMLLLIGFFIFMLTPLFEKIILSLFGNVKRFRIGERIQKLLNSFSLYKENKIVVISSFFISIIMQFFFGASAFFISKALGFNLNLVEVILITSAINFITMLPISFSGIGIREGGFIFFLSDKIGLEGAVALSLLYYFSGILAFSPFGLLVFISEPVKWTLKKEEL